MAVLPLLDRQRIWRALMRATNVFGGVPNVVKADLQAAVNAADAWVDTNAASFNTALPEPFKSNASASQKSLLLVGVVLMRFNLELLKRIFGEVD